MKNRYAHGSRISDAKTRQIVRYFAADLTALQTADLTGLNRNTVNRYYRAIRERIHSACGNRDSAYQSGEADNGNHCTMETGSYDCISSGTSIIFGIFEQHGRVTTEVVPDSLKPALKEMIRGKRDPATVTNSDEWRGYDGLVDLNYGHYRVAQEHCEIGNGRPHINGIEGFWGLAKVRFGKFKGVPKHTFHLHLKEMEWRYNHRDTDKYKTLLAYLREEPLS